MSDTVAAQLASTLNLQLSKQAITLFTASGIINTNFGLAANNVAAVLMLFYNQNGRLPKIIFNDGWPATFAPLKLDKSAKSPFSVYPVLRVPIKTTDNGTFTQTVIQPSEQQDNYVQNVVHLNGEILSSRYGIGDAYNTPVPLNAVQYGACPNWALFILIYSHPEFTFASDEGIMLTPQGVDAIERMAPYWFHQYDAQTGKYMQLEFDATANAYVVSRSASLEYGETQYKSVADYLQSIGGASAPTLGCPLSMVQQLEAAAKQAHDSTGYVSFFAFIAQMVLTFMSFYAGAGALNGLMSGVYSLANFSGAVGMAGKLGIQTGQLSQVLKVANLTDAGDLLNNTSNSGGPTVDSSYTSSASNYDSSTGLPPGDWGPSVDYTGDFNMSDANLSDIGQGLLTEGNQVDAYVADANWADAQTALESWDADLARVDPTELDVIAASHGDLTPAQFSSLAQSPGVVANAAGQVLKASGGSVTSATPAQLQAAQQAAQHNAASAASGSPEASLWSSASNLIGLYAQYKTRVAASTNPTRTQYPPGAGTTVRQPDGSVTTRNADGSMTTVHPDGSITTTHSGSLPSFNNQTLMIAGGVALGAAFLLSRRR